MNIWLQLTLEIIFFSLLGLIYYWYQRKKILKSIHEQKKHLIFEFLEASSGPQNEDEQNILILLENWLEDGGLLPLDEIKKIMAKDKLSELFLQKLSLLIQEYEK